MADNDTAVLDGIDVTQLETPALHARKQEAYKKAQAVLADAKEKAKEEGTDVYEFMAKGDGELGKQFKGFLGDCDILEQEIQRRAEVDVGADRIKAALSCSSRPALFPWQASPDATPASKTAGGVFVSSEQYRRRLKDGTFLTFDGAQSSPFEVEVPHEKFLGRNLFEKALLHSESTSSGGGAWVIPQFDMDVEPAARPQPDVLALLRVVPTESDTIYWMRQDTRASAATTVSQASVTTGTTGTKAESTLAWSRQTTPVEIIAEWIAVTEQQLADAPELEAQINDELSQSVRLELDNQVLNGGGTAPDLTGILNASIQSVAHSTAFSNRADTLLRAVVMVATANEVAPTGMVLAWQNWETIRILKSAGSGEYMLGPPTALGPTQLWGLPLVVTTRMSSGTALVGNFIRGARLHMRENVSVKVGLANDDFLRNMLRVRAELRAALTVRRPNAFVQVTAL